MPTANVVLIHGMPPEVVDVITGYTPDGFTTTSVHRDTSEGEIIEAVKDADFILMARAIISDDVLRTASNVKLLQLTSAGFDGYNVDLIRELGIPCANNGGSNSWAVSDHAVLLMLAVYRQLTMVSSYLRQGMWDSLIGLGDSMEMADKLVGIIGIGNIGRRVARRVQGFEAQVQYYDAYALSEEQERDLNVRRVGLDELFKTSDIVTCHTPLNDGTFRLVNAERLAMMKPSAIFVNTSRGEVVDEAALIKALQDGTIAGAGLDVFEQEPTDPANPLLAMDNVIATPHIAGATWDSWFRRSEFAYANMKRVWEGGEAQSLIDEGDTNA